MKKINEINEATRKLYVMKAKECVNPEVPWKKLNSKYDLDVAMWIDENKKELHINFEGSVSKIDWKVNFSFWKKPYKNMNKTFFVHSGFISAYRSGRNEIHDLYLKNMERIEKIVIRGYSLGDALARFCFEDFFWHKENTDAYRKLKIDGFGIGGPKVVGLIGRKEFDRRMVGYTRIENHSDIVPRVPFFWLGYFRTGDYYRIGRKSLWPFSAKAIYQHWYESYIGYLENPEDYKDGEGNNFLYSSAKKIFRIINFSIIILAMVIAGIITIF